MVKRHLTEWEEQVVRTVHHDFGGHSRKNAARHLGTTKNAIDSALKRVKRKAPQLFPILTRQQKQVYDLLNKGYTRNTIAAIQRTSTKNIDNIIQQLHKKGFDQHRLKTTIAYDPHMDDRIVRKF